MKFTASAVALLLANLALAHPKSKRDCPSITPNTQSCTATDHGLFASYGTHIGITYAGGSGCDNVYNSLAPLAVTNWQCVDDGCGDTQLYFNLGTGNGADINSALEGDYPTIAGGFNCPDY